MGQKGYCAVAMADELFASAASRLEPAVVGGCTGEMEEATDRQEKHPVSSDSAAT